ncbi:MAG: NAD(P)H-quinone oxidoreductase subunit L [Cyanobacteria bacterium]|nr:NAD(P)H-quinone oxidoreductase subunit L [Cyanobacteria bacterium CG_2015-16_32_12]NCO77569.1 NAD(P)H-quinone oxidoreductase subunit L [Cyanobacteria bacterium CG_2015-22_32_23]NCQ03565.1 NAD(P)H-quinone oxidoreductase subunit L [Cyanobacteria bacterium CG_2015-09_32_10]NCQ42684.1 NAD(P)H-quinone oxidoreductase subunit L [Cyanobacteria bacterium CG_2015-04_32_10]NCS84856.1 NAD(P)H-quinone oxidoreductase subunit L [Cyanobacteria bacterium CG_2015-02_32_10]
MENLLNIENIDLETIITAILYLSLSGLYLLILPAMVYFYLNKRWYVASSFERGFMYFMVFFSFPGMLLLSPFLNFRPHRRQLS